MKFVMDERVKHRLTGVVVILAIVIVFLPALLKKSNQHFEDNISLSIKLPAKPLLPVVSMPNKNQMFQSVKVAHVDLPAVAHDEAVSSMVKAEPISIKSTLPAVPSMQKDVRVAKVEAEPTLTSVVIASPKVRPKPMALKKGTYGVQLASFSQQSNAALLVAKLRQKGYVATYNKYNGKRGEFYKVVVGQLQRDEAQALQKRLAANMQLNGFIVRQG